jgi:hypothetical protein
VTLTALLQGDFNGDEIPDLVSLDQTGSLRVVLGNGDGTFGVPISLASAIGSQSRLDLTGDFNNDGIEDFIVSDTGSVQVQTFLGNGDGTFTPTVTSFSAQGLTVLLGVVAGDYNGDGKLDLACECQNTTGGLAMGIMLGNGDGTFQPPIESLTQTSNEAIPALAADFNGDNKLDVVTLETGGVGGILIPAFAQLMIGNGDGTFQIGANYSLLLDWVPVSAVAADFNGDGKLDFAVTELDCSTGNGCGESGALLVFLGNGDGTFQQLPPYYFDGGVGTISVADFDGDDKLDISLDVDSVSGQILMFYGNGDGTFRPSVVSVMNGGVPGLSSAVGDFNNDGRMDIVTNAGIQSLMLFAQTGSSSDGPAVSLSSHSLVFSTQPLGTSSQSQTVTLTNTGNSSLTITSTTISGTNATDFAQSNACGGIAIPPNGTCQISVVFTPTAQGTRSASVSITDNAAGSPHLISLSGSGSTPSFVSLSPSSLAFPAQYVGTSGLPQSVTVSNTGTAALAITSVVASPASFGVLNACGSSVAAGSNCSIGVFFDPTAAGSTTGSLILTDSAGDSPQTVALSGTGQDFSMTPDSSSANVTPGQTASYSVSVSPAGGFSQTVAVSCSGAPAQSTCSVSPSTVTLNGSSATTVTVAVTTTGASSKMALSAALPTTSGRLPIWLGWLGLPGFVVLSSFAAPNRHRRMVCALALVCLLSLSIAWTGCGAGGSSNTGGGGGGGTLPGSYSLTVAGAFTSGTTTITHNAPLTLVVE